MPRFWAWAALSAWSNWIAMVLTERRLPTRNVCTEICVAVVGWGMTFTAGVATGARPPLLAWITAEPPDAEFSVRPENRATPALAVAVGLPPRVAPAELFARARVT